MGKGSIATRAMKSAQEGARFICAENGQLTGACLGIHNGFSVRFHAGFRLSGNGRSHHGRVATVRFSSVSSNLTGVTLGSVTVRFGSNWYG